MQHSTLTITTCEVLNGYLDSSLGSTLASLCILNRISRCKARHSRGATFIGHFGSCSCNLSNLITPNIQDALFFNMVEKATSAEKKKKKKRLSRHKTYALRIKPEPLGPTKTLVQ